MSETRTGTTRVRTGRKTRDRAFMLPLVGVVLLLPPFADIFQIDFRVAGIPFTAVYLFVVWAALIVGAMIISRQLSAAYDPDDEAGAE